MICSTEQAALSLEVSKVGGEVVVLDGINLLEFGVFGGAFFLLLLLFIRTNTSNNRFIQEIIKNNKEEMRAQREAFTSALHEYSHEIAKKLVAIDIKLDSHIKSGGKDD